MYSNIPASVSDRDKKRLHTVHDELHITNEAVNDLKRLGSGHASFV